MSKLKNFMDFAKGFDFAKADWKEINPLVDEAAAEYAALVDALKVYANPDNWVSSNGVMVLKTLDRPWNYAAAVLAALDSESVKD